MLEKCKNSLRISGNDFDIEVQDLIDECKSDLESEGIAKSKIVDTDPLIRRAIITYCKAFFGWDNPEREIFIQSYISQKNKLSLDSNYIGVII